MNSIEIVRKLSSYFGYNPITITLIGQQSEIESIRTDAIFAYYILMEENSLQKSVELSLTG
jgi:hypothetical protein